MKAFFAIVYELCLDGACVAKDDPLYETSYIGQAGRYASSAEEALEMRWYEHQYEAKGHPKEVGLKWALQKYGPEAFSKRVICFLKFASRCIEALDYMNAVEIEEIDCRGGVMKDIAPPSPVWQTFNLTIGGQGDASATFASLQAKEKQAWKSFQEKVLELIAETGTCKCHTDFVLKCGYHIGLALSKVRLNLHFLNGVDNASQRRTWLEKLPGWSWTALADIRNESWNVFQSELLSHFKEFGTAYVRHYYVSPSGYQLGTNVSKVRNVKQFLHGDNANERIDWLNKLDGWTWNGKDSIEARKLQGASSSKTWDNPEITKQRVEKMLETKKRKREERWAELDEVQIVEAKRTFEIVQRKMAKINTDLAALRATLVPKAKRGQISRYRKDGTVAKAHQILRERSVDAGV